MSNIKSRRACVLYLTGTCNLNCVYCYIDKSPALQKIDKLLDECYKTDYFFNFIKELFPDPQQLIRLEFWGGEPSFGLPRATPTIKKLIEYYPNLHEFMMSTNLTLPNVNDYIFGFIDTLGEYPQRQMEFDLQLSIDGPTNINDRNRGQGTTKKFATNFAKLVTSIDKVLDRNPNVHISAHVKPTLDDAAIAELQTKEAIIEYHKFFDQFQKASDRGSKNDRWFFGTPLPNTAVPSPHTKESGLKFANFCRLSAEIMQDQKNGIFELDYPRNIMLFCDPHPEEKHLINSLCDGCPTCGTGSIILGVLPNRLISVCHDGFTHLVKEYKDYVKQHIETQQEDYRVTDLTVFINSGSDTNKYLYHPEEYELYENITNCFNPQAKFQVSEYSTLIRLCAKLGQIDKKYLNKEEAIRAAHFIFIRTSSCLRDNLDLTGSRYLIQIGFIRLFLNGAKEYIEEWG